MALVAGAGAWERAGIPVNETLTGEVRRVTYESEETGFRVLQLDIPGRGMMTAVGKFQFVAAGANVRVTGELRNDPKHGEQFRVNTLVCLEPNTLRGLERHLGSGLIPGVGPAIAKRIVTQFGLQTLEVLDQAPHRLREVKGLGKQRRRDIQERWSEHRAMADLSVLLASHGISAALGKKIVERFGDRTAEIVQTNPYRLAMDVSGIGFRTADRIARGLGLKEDHPERVQAGVHHLLNEWVSNGHVFAPRDQLTSGAMELLDVSEEHVPPAIDALWAKGRLVVEPREAASDEPNASSDAVYPALLHQAEVDTVSRVAELLSMPVLALSGVEEAMARFEKSAMVELASEQRRAVQTAADHKIVIITGGPGVGKTTIVRAVLDVFEQAKFTTALAAPTGRAAKRLSEATTRGASTLHRLLEFDPKTRAFKRDRTQPLEAQAVIVDEASMIDLMLARALFEALPERARLVIVGDADQLPSVAAGAVLRDLIESGVIPVVSLTRVFRQVSESQIVHSAHAILRGEEPMGAEAATPNADFFVIERTDAEQAAATIEELVKNRIPTRFGLDPKSDVQVLCPMHRGPCGTVLLNQRLQAVLNPNTQKLVRGTVEFRLGDRVMQLKNDYDREVYNGDQGRIVRLDEGAAKLAVEFDGRVVEYELGELDNLALCYATTVHKSQGSEYPAVVIPLLTSHFVMLSMNLVYTAVTRARRLCVLVCDKKALRIALSETRREFRHTRMRQRLREAVRAPS